MSFPEIYSNCALTELIIILDFLAFFFFSSRFVSPLPVKYGTLAPILCISLSFFIHLLVWHGLANSFHSFKGSLRKNFTRNTIIQQMDASECGLE